ncbi:MAG: hypothetical protein IPI67_08270 [Myxococcales bacterium]|nr:hypothetical protein [Myxococcales bacterium]
MRLLFALFDRLAVTLFDGRARRIRGLVATVYVMLALLALMQLVSPGALERIASQPVGVGLLAVLCALLVVNGLFVIGGVALWRSESALDLGVGDALLNFSLAVAGLNLLFGKLLVSDSVGALWVGGAGLATAGAGLYRVALALWNRPPVVPDTVPYRPARARRSSQLVRGAVFITLGALQFVAAAGNLTEQSLLAQSGLVALGLLAGATLALGGYAAHMLWSMNAEDSFGFS